MAEILKHTAENTEDSFCLAAVKVALVIRLKIKSFNFIKSVDLVQNAFSCRMDKLIL